jgi:hypothetical protein
MFMIYSLISGFASAINGSINQQKVTRAYFYYRAQNNSTIPKPGEGTTYLSWTRFGMFFIGWKERFDGSDVPILPCYKLSVPLKPADKDKCEEKYLKATSQFIRVGTVYGVCGATYGKKGSEVYQMPDTGGAPFSLIVDRNACAIQ